MVPTGAGSPKNLRFGRTASPDAFLWPPAASQKQCQKKNRKPLFHGFACFFVYILANLAKQTQSKISWKKCSIAVNALWATTGWYSALPVMDA